MTQVTDGEAERSRTVRKVWLPLPSPAQGPSNARAFVRGALSCWDVGEASMADVAHVASELVALAFRLRAQSLELELDLDEEFVHVRVRGTANDEATDDSGAGEDPAAARDAAGGEPDDGHDAVPVDSPELFVVGRLATDWTADLRGGLVDLWARVMVEADPLD